MKLTPSLAGMVAAFTMALHAGSVPRASLKSEDWRYGRKRRKKGGGSGGAGVITRKGPITRQPVGYYAQVTPLKHMHAEARRMTVRTQAWERYESEFSQSEATE